MAPQPWFENQFPGLARLQNAASATAFIIGRDASNFAQGNVGTLFINMAGYRRSLGMLPLTNDQAQVQFMRTYIGQSNYNGGILSVSKRTSHGLSVTANYTYAKALDDFLSNQNNAGYYANSFHPGVDYGPTGTFDRRHVFNAFYSYDVPLGAGHALHGGKLINHIIGGWYTGGIVTLFSGAPLTVTQTGQTWGGATATIGVNTAMVPIGPVAETALNSGSAGCNLTGVGSVGTTAATGAGLNIFANPCAAYSNFRYISLSADTRTGRANPMRGLPFRNMDVRFGKDTKLRSGDRPITLGFSADFFNVFNYHNFNTPALAYTNPTSFGVITSTFTPANRTNSARWIEFGLRIDF